MWNYKYLIKPFFIYLNANMAKLRMGIQVQKPLLILYQLIIENNTKNYRNPKNKKKAARYVLTM